MTIEVYKEIRRGYMTSDNNIFKLRGIRPSFRPKLDVDSEGHFSNEVANSAGHIPLPNRIRPPFGVKVEGRCEYNNVI